MAGELLREWRDRPAFRAFHGCDGPHDEPIASKTDKKRTRIEAKSSKAGVRQHADTKTGARGAASLPVLTRNRTGENADSR
jgi:hypothetical protein